MSRRWYIEVGRWWRGRELPRVVGGETKGWAQACSPTVVKVGLGTGIDWWRGSWVRCVTHGPKPCVRNAQRRQGDGGRRRVQ